MKKPLLFALGLLCGWPSLTFALTLSWDANPESDMKEYQVYACWTPGCVIQKTKAFQVTVPSGIVPHPTTAGAIVKWPIPAGKSGALAVTAIDQSGNESPLSAQLTIDQIPPGAIKSLTVTVP